MIQKYVEDVVVYVIAKVILNRCILYELMLETWQSVYTMHFLFIYLYIVYVSR